MHVYVITNLVNGKVYIGQHCHDDLESYFKHQLPEILAGSKRKPRLYNAIRKHGIENFSIASLVQPIDKAQMDALEKFFIRTFDSQSRQDGYNITAGGEGTAGYSHPEEIRQRIREKMTGRVVTEAFREKIGRLKRGNTYSLGIKLSEAQCIAISLRQRGNSNALGAVRSPETRAKMSLAAHAREAHKREAKASGGAAL